MHDNVTPIHVLSLVDRLGLRGASRALSMSLLDTTRIYGRALVDPSIPAASKIGALTRIDRAVRLGAV